MSLIDISTTDDEDTHKRKVCELTHKNDTDFSAWRDKLIPDGVVGIQEWDKTVNDYTDPGKKKLKNPDTIEPPISYMKEHRVFQPLPSTTNPLGLCHFCPANRSSFSTLVPPKLPATMDHLNNLLVLAKSQQWPYIIVVFEGGPIMPLGLLQELHSCHTLVHIPIILPEETKDGHKPRISCFPFCAYTIQNDLVFLNHIINAHYHANFTCGRCLSAVTTLGQQMKRHISECPRLPILPKKLSQDSVCGEHSLKKCTDGSSGSKSKDGGSKSKQKHKTEKSQQREPASQEDSQTNDRHLTHMASTSQESTTRSSQCHFSGKKKVKKVHKKKKSGK